MLTLDQCLNANRPLIFVVAESDIEVLQHIQDNYSAGQFSVYSTSLANMVELSKLMDSKFNVEENATKTTNEVLLEILHNVFPKNNNKFKTFIFLNADAYIHDKQIIRRIKDIISRYQLEDTYTVNLIFISHVISVPAELERLSEVVFFDLPNNEILKDLSDSITKKLNLDDKDKPTDEVINNLKGLTKFEVEQAYLQSYQIYKSINLNFIRDFKKNAIAKTDLLSLLETNISFEDIGGMSVLKEWVRKSYGGWTVEGQKFGLPLLKGLLMVGLPGCGKSLLCKALGNEWGLPLVQFDPSRVFSSRVGDSEHNIRRVLQIIENMSPVILFVDEIEKGFAGMQSSTFSDAGVTARVIGSFLIWLQECTKPVFTIATSNAIQYLPPELISRFDETFFVGLPQFQERCEIFRIHLKKVNRDPEKFHIEQLAQHSQDLSGREIEQVIREALYDAFYNKKEFDTGVILKVLEKKTNLLTTMAEQLDFLLKWVGWDDTKKDGIRARFASSVEDINDMNRIKDQIDKLIAEIGDKKSTNE